MAVVKFDVVTLPEEGECGVYARVGDDATLLVVFSTKAAATAFAVFQAKTPANYGNHPDGAAGWTPPVPFV